MEPVLLVKNGVREERAFDMDHDERLAWLIVIGRADGNRWNWDLMCWEDPK